MTLKEKFKEILIAFWTSEWESECEQVADEFAIGFAEWYKKVMKAVEHLTYEKNWMNKTTKELLEIYKKEKGL